MGYKGKSIATIQKLWILAMSVWLDPYMPALTAVRLRRFQKICLVIYFSGYDSICRLGLMDPRKPCKNMSTYYLAKNFQNCADNEKWYGGASFNLSQQNIWEFCNRIDVTSMAWLCKHQNTEKWCCSGRWQSHNSSDSLAIQ